MIERLKYIMNQRVDPETGLTIIFGMLFVMGMTFVIMNEWGKKRHKDHPHPSH